MNTVYSPLALSLLCRAMAIARRDHIHIEKREALSELELSIIRGKQTFDPSKGASNETWVLSIFKHQIRAAYGSPGGHPVYSFDETLYADDGSERPRGYLEFEAIRAADERRDDIAAEIKRPLPADKRDQLNALPADLRRVAASLINNDFDREATAEALGVGERQVRRACNDIIALMQQAGGLPAQADLF